MSQSNQNKKQNKSRPARKRAGRQPQKRSTARNGNRVNRIGGLTSKRGFIGPLKLGSSSSSGTTRQAQIIEEDEYIAEVNGSVAFVTTAYPINPGQAGTFPWGAKIAALYEKYDFLSLEFYYRREVSEYATNGQAGKIILSCDYDASDNAPTSKQQVLDTVPHADGMPCMPVVKLRIDPRQARNQDSKYVRPGAQPANTDIKTYDVGNLYVSTQGCTNTTVIGELRVKYKCSLKIPVLEPPTQTGGGFLIQSAVTGETAGATTVQTTLFASATNPVISINTLGATVAASGLITLPVGKYLVAGNCLCSDSAAAVTAGNLGLYQSATSDTNVVVQTSVGISVQDQVSTHNALSLLNYSIIWDTSQSGLVLAMQCAATYASGTCLNQGYLSITYLGAPL
jgi:hypothetical protein